MTIPFTPFARLPLCPHQDVCLLLLTLWTCGHSGSYDILHYSPAPENSHPVSMTSILKNQMTCFRSMASIKEKGVTLFLIVTNTQTT